MHASVDSWPRQAPAPAAAAPHVSTQPVSLCVTPRLVPLMPLQLSKVFAEAEQEAGPMDVLVCNAGLSLPGGLQPAAAAMS